MGRDPGSEEHLSGSTGAIACCRLLSLTDGAILEVENGERRVGYLVIVCIVPSFPRYGFR